MIASFILPQNIGQCRGTSEGNGWLIVPFFLLFLQLGPISGQDQRQLRVCVALDPSRNTGQSRRSFKGNRETFIPFVFSRKLKPKRRGKRRERGGVFPSSLPKISTVTCCFVCSMSRLLPRSILMMSTPSRELKKRCGV